MNCCCCCNIVREIKCELKKEKYLKLYQNDSFLYASVKRGLADVPFQHVSLPQTTSFDHQLIPYHIFDCVQVKLQYETANSTLEVRLYPYKSSAINLN